MPAAAATLPVSTDTLPAALTAAPPPEVTPDPPSGPDVTVTPGDSPFPKEMTLEEALGKHLSGDIPALPAKVVEPAVTPAKDPEVPLVDEDAADKATMQGMGAKERAAFQNLRRSERDLKRQVKEKDTLKAELDALKAAAPVPDESTKAELASLRTKYEAAQNVLAVANLEATEMFQAQVTQPLNSLEESIKGIATENGIAAEDVLAAIKSAPSKERSAKISSLLEGLNDFDKTQVVQYARDYANLNAKAVQLRAQAKEFGSKIEADAAAAKAQETAAHSAAWNKASTESWTEIENTLPLLKPTEGDEKWNAVIEGAKEFGRNVTFADLDVPSQAQGMHRIAIFPTVANIAKHALARVSELEAVNAKLKGLTPSAQPGAKPIVDKNADPHGITPTDTLEDAFAKAFPSVR